MKYLRSISIVKWILVFLYLTSHESFGSTIKYAPKIKICVIGAGPAGLSTARHLMKDPNKFEITVFEKAAKVGGTWVYNDETGIDKNGYPVHSSMYKNLRTNNPIEIMNFPDWPKYEGVHTSTVPHYIVQEYLKNYTDHFQLRRFIKFNTIVEDVKLQKEKDLDQWKVTVKNLKTSSVHEYTFDAVIICTGHFFSPRIPIIPGLEDFKGIKLHSHDYRKPEYFKNKNVIVLGAGPSGIDIAQDLTNVASKVFLSHNHKKVPVSLNQVSGVDRFENGKFILKDNSSVSADVLLFCTGYHYAFPFLDDSTGIRVEDDYISTLYKHMVNIEHPSMSFVGIPQGFTDFLMLNTQAQYISAIMNGKVRLPSKEVMMEDSKLKTEKNKAHKLNLTNSWKYMDELASLAGFMPIPEHYKIGFRAWAKFLLKNFDDYKNYNLVIAEDKLSATVVKP